MAITQSGPMFLKSLNLIDKHMRDAIMEVGPKNAIQIITYNAYVCKAVGMLIELEFPSNY